MSSPTIAFLGPEGTFAHLATRERFGHRRKFVPVPSVKEVFGFVRSGADRLGVVPIENSSGGTIRETVECLTDDFARPLFIQEALSVNVRLALLGHDKNNIRVIYSHFAPLHHCENWLRVNFPNAELSKEPSTASAAKKAATIPDAAAIGTREAAQKYGLEVLEFPIEKDCKNVTQFFIIGHKRMSVKTKARTTVIVALPNKPGSLCDFLEPFKKRKLNLTRLISQPVVGRPETYIFLVDIDGSETDKNVQKTLNETYLVAQSVKSLGSYSVRDAYES